MLGLESTQIFHGIGLFVIVNYVMVTAAHQDQIVVPVPFFWRLARIKARASLTPCLDMADSCDNLFSVNEG